MEAVTDPARQTSSFPETVDVTMEREAAERFQRALSYAEAVLATMADANAAPSTKTAIEDHCGWLQWGIGRIERATGQRP